MSYASPEAAVDAVDNMHLNSLPGPSNRGRVLKVNKAKPQKGAKLVGSNKPSASSFSPGLLEATSRVVRAA